MKRLKLFVPLILSMAFFISSAICVYGATCTDCNGKGTVTTNSVTEERDCTYCDDGLESVPLNCEYCDGAGAYKCDKCNGLGELESGQHVDCDKCNGRGYFVHEAQYIPIDCPTCNDGYIVSYPDCSSCTDGYNNCLSCNGSGKEWKDEVSTMIKCETCEGKGNFGTTWVVCYDCGGHPLLDGIGRCENSSCRKIFDLDDYMNNNWECPYCNNAGYEDVYCSSCGADGKMDVPDICDDCDGVGKITEITFEAGYYTCSVCKNVEGKVKCAVCNGSGNITASSECSSCDGVGYTYAVVKPSYNEDCADCEDGYITVWENVTCSDCGGNGYLDCNVCDNGLCFDEVICSHCDGKGTYNHVISQGQTVTCDKCNGSGVIANTGNPDIVVNNFHDYCEKHGLLPFDFYDDNYAYVYWYYSDIDKYMLLGIPRDVNSNLPISLDSYDTVCLLESDSKVSSQFVGYMWDSSKLSWVDNVEAWGKSVSSVPQILYSDCDIWVYNGEDWILNYDGYVDYNPANSGGSSGGSSSDSEEDKELNKFQQFLVDLFVPTFSPVEDMFDLMHDKIPIVTQLYAFVYNFITLCDNFDFTNYEPRVYMNFSGAFGVDDEVNVFDVSWYQPYRDTVNAILSAFLWLGFAFSVYKKIPSLLGVSS